MNSMNQGCSLAVITATTIMADLNERLQTAVTRIRALLPDHLQQPIWGIVCGSGLGTLSANLQDVHTLDAADIGFARSSVEGHLGKLAFGTLSGVPVVCQLGRLHAYEGHLIPEVVFPIRCFAQLGVKSVISERHREAFSNLAFRVDRC